MVILLLPFSFVLESKKCIGGRPRGCCRVIREIIAFAIWLVSVLAKIINQELYKYNVCMYNVVVFCFCTSTLGPRIL